MRNVRARIHAAALAALALTMSGCMMVGFDPLDDEPAALSPQGGTGQSGGTGGAGGVAGQSSSGIGGSASNGSGGMMSVMPDAGAGGTMVVPMSDASVPMADAGVITNCTGKDDFDACEDGLYCTVRDFCINQVCASGTPRPCGDECNSGACNEVADTCDLTPLPNDTKCGVFNAFVCSNGTCTSPLTMCTEGGECTPSCTNAACNVSCPNANSCKPSCTNGADCNIDCKNTAECAIGCEDSSCVVSCQGSGICAVGCTGSDTECVTFCTDASGCDQITCLDGASCVLTCDPGETCGFQDCWDVEEQCGDGSVVCNADCP